MTAASDPLLVTERLELWRPRRGDMEAMFAIVSDPRTNRYLGRATSMADHYTRFCRNAGSWQIYGYGGFTLRLRGRAEMIGQCGVFHSWRGLGDDFDDHPEAGWILAHEHTGQGFAREAVEAALAWFDREHGPRRVVCMIDLGNTPSLRLAAALGFTAMRDARLPDGEEMRLMERESGSSA